MKSIAVIPTKNRSVVNQVIQRISSLVDIVYVVSKHSTFASDLPGNVKIVEGDFSLDDARNMGMNYGLKKGADIIFQIDDDVYFTDETIEAMYMIFVDEPKISAVSSDPQLLAFWSKELETNKPYKISGVASQLWAVRADAVREVRDNFYGKYFEYETMEDIRFSAKLWTLGLPVVRLHGNTDLFHKPIITRTSKTDEQGGQTISERNKYLPKAIKYIQAFVGKDRVLRFCKLSKKPDGQLAYRIGYNYDIMCCNSKMRNGKIGYTDNRGRSL